jgi:hypothetical protein
VVSEQGGVWGTAIDVPGLAALDVDGYSGVSRVSCATAGNCVAAGSYGTSTGNQAFVVSETGGVWGTAIEVPGLAALDVGGGAVVTSVSCGSPGNCTAGGSYFDTQSYHAFLVSENDGTWGKAFDLGTTGDEVVSVSCTGAGDCVAGGGWSNRVGRGGAFVVEERNGTWSHRRKLPGIAFVSSVSCASPGNCAAAAFGAYARNRSHVYYVFVVDEKDGKWGHPMKVAKVQDVVDELSCASTGNCVAGLSASAWDHAGLIFSQAYLASERNGRWGPAFVVPGISQTAYDLPLATTDSVSCASAGNCAATGVYTDASGQHAYVVAERNGVWGAAEDVPDMATLGDPTGSLFDGNASALSVSCASAGNCAVGGSYLDGSGHEQAFVTTP